MAFTQRATNTNLILLEAPHRYDLHCTSCVNAEVKFYNRKLQSIMSTANHVKVLKASTERKHHTGHGLHLNNRGKDWIVYDIVNEIKNLNSFYDKSITIELPWPKKTNCSEGKAPPNRYVSHTKPEDNSTEITYSSQPCEDEPDPLLPTKDSRQEEIVLRKSVRPKQPPINKYQDFFMLKVSKC